MTQQSPAAAVDATATANKQWRATTNCLDTGMLLNGANSTVTA